MSRKTGNGWSMAVLSPVKQVTGDPDAVPENYISRRYPQVFLWCGSEAKKHPGQLVHPAGPGETGTKSSFHGPVHSLHHSIRLRVIGSGVVELGAQTLGQELPN